MRFPSRRALLSMIAAALLAFVLGATRYVLYRGPVTVETAEEVLPSPPPAPPWISDEPDYSRCLDSLGDDPQAALSFGESWSRRGGGDGATHCIALALLSLGETERAAASLEELAAQFGASSRARAAIYGQAGQAWITAGSPERAYDAITLGLLLCPSDPDLLVDRAGAAGALGRFGAALIDATRATVLNAERPEPWIFRAAALRHLDRAQEAMRDVERALYLDPDSPEGLLERGILRQLNGDLEGARFDWERAADVAPESAAANLAQQNLALSEAGPSRR